MGKTLNDIVSDLSTKIDKMQDSIDIAPVADALWNVAGQVSVLSTTNDKLEKLEATLASIESNSISQNKGGLFSRLLQQTHLQENVKDIKGDVHISSQSLSRIAGYTGDMTKYLRSINDFITSSSFNQQSPAHPQNSNNNAQQSGSSINDIVTDILKEIEGFRSDFGKFVEGKEFNTGDEKTDKLLKENKIARLKREAAKEEQENIIRDTSKSKEQKDAAKKELTRLYKEEEKANKDIENARRKAKGGVSASAKKWTDLGTDVGKSVIGGKIDSSATIDKGIGMISQMGPWGMGIGAVLSILKAGFDLYAKQDKLAGEYARTVGGSKFEKNASMIREADFVRRNSTWKNNYTPDEVYSAWTSFAEATGRIGDHLTDASLKSLIDLKRMGIDGDVLTMFDNMGKSAESTDDYFSKLYSDAGSKGLSFKKMSEAVKNNLKTAQRYTFANGINGLTKMAETSARLKYNMSEVFKFADKVSTLEGATKTASELSVLGGDFARFADPLELLYEANYDPEALNNRMIDMVSNMGKYNARTQQIDINPYDKARLKQAAESMGVSYDDLISASQNKARENLIDNQIGKGYNEQTANYIRNLAQLDENGRAYVEIEGINNGGRTYLNSEEFKNIGADVLKKESEEKALKDNARMGDVFNETRGINERLDQIFNYLSTQLGAWVAKIAGVKWSGYDEKRYWKGLTRKEKKELGELYGGSKKDAKRAAKTGRMEDVINEKYGGGDAELGARRRAYFNARMEENLTKVQRKNLYNSVINGRLDGEMEKWEEGQKSSNGSNSYRATNTNSGRDYSSDVSNVKSSNYMQSSTIAEASPAKNVNIKTETEPVNVNINIKADGKTNLTEADKRSIERQLEPVIINTIRKNGVEVVNILAKVENGGIGKNQRYNGAK